MVSRAALVSIVTAVSIGCSSTAGVRGPAPFPLAKTPGAPADAVAGAATDDAASPVSLAAILDTALALRGTAYRLGGHDPVNGFDCSGLVQYVYARHAIVLPRTVTEQFTAGQSIGPDEIRAGDLLFFSTTAPGPTHVGIALGPLSQGEFVHAPGTGSAVRVERLDTPYWRARWVGAKRLAP